MPGKLNSSRRRLDVGRDQAQVLGDQRDRAELLAIGPEEVAARAGNHRPVAAVSDPAGTPSRPRIRGSDRSG